MNISLIKLNNFAFGNFDAGSNFQGVNFAQGFQTGMPSAQNAQSGGISMTDLLQEIRKVNQNVDARFGSLQNMYEEVKNELVSLKLDMVT